MPQIESKDKSIFNLWSRSLTWDIILCQVAIVVATAFLVVTIGYSVMSKQLVEMMGGQIGVESQEGQGSTFWFTAKMGKSEGLIDHNMTVIKSIQGKRFLVVDDNATHREVLQQYIKSWGDIRLC